MKSKKGTKKELSRRDFIKTTAVGVGATAVAGLTAKEAKAQDLVVNWDKEADVVVVGFGGAGAAAAIEAHDAGAQVLLLEKLPAGGGSTAMSGGFFATPKAPLSLDDIVTYIIACGRGRVDKDMATAWAQEAINLPAWVKGLGGTIFSSPALVGYHQQYQGANQIVAWGPPQGSGVALFKVLSDAVNARNIEVLFETPTTELLATADGKVLGVKVESKGWDRYIKAKRGVVLTCGGLDYNEWMKLHYLRAYPTYSVGSPGNTGDAITLAGKLGAKLWKMPELCGNLAHKFPGVDIAWPSMLQLGIAGLSAIFVNKHGQRFTDETLTYDSFHKALTEFDSVNDEYPNIPCYGIFDETARLAVPVGYGRGWSADNSVEIAKEWIIKGGTIKELAIRISMDPATLENTVDLYNAYCAAGQDFDFGRKALKPIKRAPFYAIESYPGTWGTWGGPKINTQAQVVDTSDNVIPRLYAAGNASCGAFGFYYPLGGGCIGDAFAFGRIAGRNVAAETAWS